MSTKTCPKPQGRARRRFVQQPRGVIHPRVQQVGPQHFGILCVDCAKARSKWMLCDFYGNVLIEPTLLVHAQGHFQAAIALAREALQRHRIQDQLAVVERTGNYHLPVKRAFAAAGFETRIVHPFATKQYRQAAHPGNKTDDTDLLAIFRAATAGFGLEELPVDGLLAILQAAIEQIPQREHGPEAAPLRQQLEKNLNAKRGPKPIGDTLPVVLARLGVGQLQLPASEAQDPS